MSSHGLGRVFDMKSDAEPLAAYGQGWQRWASGTDGLEAAGGIADAGERDIDAVEQG